VTRQHAPRDYERWKNRNPRTRHPLTMKPALSGWMDPNGKIYEALGTLKHWAWIEDNKEMLKKIYGLKVPEGDTAPAYLMSSGWVRLFVNDKATEACLQARKMTSTQLVEFQSYLKFIGQTLQRVYVDYDGNDSFGSLFRCGAWTWEEFKHINPQKTLDDVKASYDEQRQKTEALNA